jgi:hypothetical protein
VAAPDEQAPGEQASGPTNPTAFPPTSVPPELVYHYTTGVGLKGIVEEKALWATDVRFLNDATELVVATTILRNQLKDLPMPEPDWFEENDEGQQVPMWEGMVGPAAAEFLEEVEQYFRCYVSCFCEQDDLLSQWRAYGAGGYSLAFQTDKFDLERRDYDTARRLMRVEYNHDAVVNQLAALAAQLHAHRTAHSSIEAYHQVLWLLPELASVKGAAFSEENEWRLVVTEMVHGALLEPNFRPSQFGLVPYVEIPIPEGSLRQVRVGPGANQDLRVKGAQEFLHRHRLDDVDVALSAAPFRG